jgi:hypothetical protein
VSLNAVDAARERPLWLGNYQKYMNRRPFIFSMAMLVTLPTLAKSNQTPSESAQHNVGILMDLIIPKTNTPSATGISLHKNYLAYVQAHIADVKAFDAACAGLVARLPLAKSKSEFVNDWAHGKLGNPELFAFFKDMTTRLYYSSEYATTKILAWLPVPGPYVGKLRFNTINRVWAS